MDIYIDRIIALTYSYPSWGVGRIFFRALMDIYPGLALQIQGTDFDPSLDDCRLGIFYMRVESLLSPLVES